MMTPSLFDRLDRRGIVLMYHRIFENSFDPRQLCVSPDNFEAHLRVIKKLGRIVPMKDMGRSLKSFSFGRRDIVITFDDGYRDNFQPAKPLLERYHCPAVFYIVPGAVGSKREFFRDYLEQILLAPKQLPAELSLETDHIHYQWRIEQEGPCERVNYAEPLGSLPENGSLLTRSMLYRVITHVLAPLGEEERMDSIQALADRLKQTLQTRQDYLPMDMNELQTLARSPLFEIGAHSLTHPHLSKLTAQNQQDEIRLSKKFLEDYLGRPITSFAYPHGDYSEQTVEIVRQIGFNNACTVNEEPVTRQTDPFLIPRYMVLNWDGPTFEEHLKRWLAQ